MIKSAFILFAFTVLLLIANRFFCTPEGTAPEIIDITGIDIIELKSDSIKLNVNVLAFNKNEREIEVGDIFLKLIAGSDTLGNVVRPEKIIMKKSDTALVEFPANLNTVKMIELAGREDTLIELKIKGEARADLGIFSLPVEIDLNHSIKFREKLTQTIEQDTKDYKLLSVEAAGLKSLSFGKSTVEVDFTLTNPYGIDILLKDYPSHIYINENQAGEGNITKEILLQKENQGVKGSVIYDLNNTETISSLFGSIFKRKLEYSTSGTLILEVLGYNIQFPFSFRGELIKL